MRSAPRTPARRPALVPSAFLAPPDGKGHGVLAEYFDNADLQGTPKLRRNEGRAYFDMEMETRGGHGRRRPQELLDPMDGDPDARRRRASTS